MSPGAKVFLTLAGVGTLLGVVLIAGAKNANASPAKPKPQVPGDNAPPDVIVPPIVPPNGQQPAQQQPAQPQPAPLPVIPTIPLPNIPALPAQPQPQPQQPAAQVPPGVTFSIPNPLGGAPLGTFDPATGNVFGPGGIIIGTFDPNSGIFTASTGQQLKIPGFGPATPAQPLPQPAPQQQLPPSLPVPVIPPQPPAPAPVLPPPTTVVSSDTANMVHALLDAELRSGWNKIDPTVEVWQGARPPLTVDGKFGPKTALTVAQEFGTVPLIRFWPLGSTKAKLLQDYRASLITLANNSADPVRAAQLRASAARETGLAFSTKGPLPPVPADQQVAIAKVA